MRHRPSRSPIAAIVFALLLVLLVTGIVACGSDSTESTAGVSSTTVASTETSAPPTTEAGATTSLAGQVQELTVSAAAALKGAFTEIAAAFDRANNAKTILNFDAAGTLQKQIEAGAPVDVFASGAPKQMNNLLEADLVDKVSVRDFAGNEIVLVVPADSTLGIASFEDLTGAEVEKVAYGDPAATAHGVAAEETLSTLGLFDQVNPKVIYAANVSQALEYVASGEVDAGIIFATEAKAGGDKVKVVAISEPAWHSEIVFPIGLVSGSEAKALGQAFVDFVISSEGQAILQKYGFLPAPSL